MRIALALSALFVVGALAWPLPTQPDDAFGLTVFELTVVAPSLRKELSRACAERPGSSLACGVSEAHDLSQVVPTLASYCVSAENADRREIEAALLRIIDASAADNSELALRIYKYFSQRCPM